MHKAAKGFTLLETILVLALVALMAVSGLAAYQQHVVNFKVEKTALQMQALLEASADYYVAQTPNTWPDSATQPAALDDYLGTDVLKKCPWSYTGTTCYILVPPPSGSAKFSVTITIPPIQTNAVQIANMIAARLPDASVSGTTVTAMEVSPPPSPVTPPTVGVVGAQAFLSGQRIPLINTCSKGTVQHVYLTMSGYTSYGYEADPNPTPDTSAGPPSVYYFVYGKGDAQTSYVNPVTSPGAFLDTLIEAREAGTSGHKYNASHAGGVAIETCELPPPPDLNILTNKQKNTLTLQF